MLLLRNDVVHLTAVLKFNIINLQLQVDELKKNQNQSVIRKKIVKFRFWLQVGFTTRDESTEESTVNCPTVTHIYNFNLLS